MKVLTVADRAGGAFHALQQSCEHFGIGLEVLGWGEPFGGFMTKPKLVYKRLQEFKNETVLFVDAFDVIFVSGIDRIESLYRKFNTPVLMSAERNCFPFIQLASSYPQCESPYRYLNSGCWIGRSNEMRLIYEQLRIWEVPDSESDQGLLTKYYLTDQKNIRLDTHCEIFQSLFQAECDLSYCGTVQNTLTKTDPCILHGNGGADMTDALKWLGDHVESRIARRTVNLLSIINPIRDSIAGVWSLNDNTLTCTASSHARIHLRYNPTRKYDFKIVFTKHSGIDAIALKFKLNNQLYALLIGGWRRSAIRFSQRDRPTDIPFRNGVKHTCVLSVWQEKIQVWFNHVLVLERKIGELPLDDVFAVPCSEGLAIGVDNSAVSFDEISVIEYSMAINEMAYRGVPKLEMRKT